MIRTVISMKGRTEEAFVKEVLADYLHPMGVFPDPWRGSKDPLSAPFGGK